MKDTTIFTVLKIWMCNDIHPRYGKVAMMRTIEGEPYRFFLKDGAISMIPLATLHEEQISSEKIKETSG